ncbi:MAG TPA: small ribosomal subunit Rsm22 family protein [Kofleriaceae bacterium]
MTAWTSLEDVVYAAARSVVGERALATSPLLEAIRDRSARYTSDRDRLARPASPTGDLAARAVFFTLADAPKVAIPLRELVSRSALPSHRPLRVVDLGAGCGAMSLGALATLTEPMEITAIDRDREALQIAAAAVKAFAPSATFSTTKADATSASIPPADLVLMGTLLNELDAPARLALVRRALASLSPDGALIILEPALRETTRALHELRDAIIGDAFVFAPCTRQCAPCPALADPTDWCHEHRRVELPHRTAELARLTHLRDDGLKFSYLVLRTTAATLSDDASAWRVTGSPWAQKGKVEVLACSNSGRTKLRLLKRNRVASNRALENVERGDIVTVDAQPDDDRIEVMPETKLTIKRPGDPPTVAK